MNQRALSLVTVFNYLEQLKDFQERERREVNPRVQCRGGIKRDVEYYSLFKPGSLDQSIEIAIAVPRVGLIHAEVFMNEFDDSQVRIISNRHMNNERAEEYIYKALAEMATRQFTEEPEIYYNPYLDGFYLSAKNAGALGIADIEKALELGEICEEFKTILRAWKFSMKNHIPDPAKIAAFEARKAARRLARAGES